MVEVLSARPPTPPRASRTLPEKDQAEASPVVAQTPGDSPFSTNASNGVLSSRQSKRVNFSPWTKYIKPPAFAASSAAKPKPDLKALPPSNECKPAAKSILKPTNSPAPVSSPNVTTPESFAMLLESVTQQLAGESISSRLDAYMQFFGALRTYEGVPGEQEIADKLGLITQFIQRDVSRDLGNGGPLDTNLVIQALKLSAALVWQTEISAQLSDDFKIFLVERSITSIQESKVPKSVLTHYMSILSTQNFSSKVMNNVRLTRLLSVLQDVTDRVTGNSIVSQRLIIYQRILGQSKSTFVSNSSLWMEHLIFGLLHHIKDIRIKAISLGFQTSMSFGPNPALSKCIRDIFDRQLDKGSRRLVTEVCERMSRMMATAESGVHVPQVWSVVILLLRNKRLNVDQWEHFKEWVLALQKCFNCSDSSIKAQAIVAWNRFVLVVSPCETTSWSLLKMLGKPILSQFERKKQDKNGSQPSQLALFSYYNLLYYAFRPSASSPHLDTVWEEYIASPSSSIFSSVPSLSDRLARVLSNMLWSSQAKVWTENKVNESNKLEPEELPSLDSRWVRSRVTLVLRAFENILKSSVWVEDLEQSNIAVAWVSLSKALSYASSKEITPSPESMQAVAHVLGLLQRLWNAGPASVNAADDSNKDKFFDRFRFLSTTMIFSLGNIPFTEKLLLKTADETFQAANTPTHRHSRATNLDSPILHFLRLISDVSGGSEPSPSYLRLINDTLEAACKGRTSRGSRLELLRQCADLYPNETEFHFAIRDFAQIVWKSTAQLAADSLCSYPIESARERDGSVSRDYENIVKILVTGLKFPDVSKVWNQLLDSFVRVVRTEKSDQEIATMAIEPLAECMMVLGARDTYLPLASLFGHSISMTYCHQDGTDDTSHVSDRLFIPNKLVGLISRTLHESYQAFSPMDTNGIADFIESLTSFLGSGLMVFRSKILESLHGPLAVWLKDETHKLDVESGVESRVLTAYRALASAILNILQASSPHDSLCLQRFEKVIYAGLESSHISILKRFLDFWNSTFGLQKSVLRPEAVTHALERLELHKSQKPDLPPSKLQTRAQKSTLGPETSNQAAEMSEKSRIAFILDNSEPSYSAGFNSSPVTRVPDLGVSVEVSDDQVPLPPSRTEDTLLGQEDSSLSFSAAAEKPKQRSEVFSMIENLRSSSPPLTNTPRELGFMTPPHLRSLRNPDREIETPQTPTLPPVAVDNEDGFLGSSPTPGTRDRPQAGGSTLRTSLTVSAASRMDNGPPSSPPEIESRSPNTRSKSSHADTPGSGGTSKSKRRREKRFRRAAASAQKKELESTASTPKEPSEKRPSKEPERPLSSRLRSSISKANDGFSTAEPQSDVSVMDQEPDRSKFVTSCNTDTPTSVFKRSRKEVQASKPTPHTESADFIADSSGDDMETQIASQLEQDLECAADMDEPKQAEAPSEPPMTRKRKRESQETPLSTPSNNERRRSSRLSTSFAVTDSEEVRSTRSKKTTGPNPAEVESSPAEAPKRRRRYSKDNTGDAEVTLASSEKQPVPDTEKGTEATVESPSQTRRSTRLSGHAATLPGTEETPLPTKSPKPLSRKQSKKQKETIPEEPPRAEAKESSKTATENEDTQISAVQETSESQTMHQPTQPQVENIDESAEAEQPDIQMVDVEEMKQKPQDTPAETTEPGIITSLNQVLNDVKSASLDRAALKEIDDLLFDIRVETHEALRRHTG